MSAVAAFYCAGMANTTRSAVCRVLQGPWTAVFRKPNKKAEYEADACLLAFGAQHGTRLARRRVAKQACSRKGIVGEQSVSRLTQYSCRAMPARSVRSPFVSIEKGTGSTAP